MSVQCMAWVYRVRVGNPTAKAILLYLAERASDDGSHVWPKIETIATVTEFSERSVVKALKLLEQRGFIRRGSKKLNMFRKNGTIRPVQYRTTVWELCVWKDPSVFEFLERTHGSERDENESVEPVVEPYDSAQQPAEKTSAAVGDSHNTPEDDEDENRGAGDAPLENAGIATNPRGERGSPLDSSGEQGCTSCSARGAGGAPLPKPSCVTLINPPVVPPQIEVGIGTQTTDRTPCAEQVETSGQDPSPPAASPNSSADDGREAALSLLDELEHWQRQAKLILPERSKRDIEAVTALVNEHEAKLVGEVMRFGLDDRWYAPQLIGGRALSRLFADMHNRLAVQRRDTDRTSPRPAQHNTSDHNPVPGYARASTGVMYGLRDDVDRHAARLLERYGEDEGHDGFTSTRTLIRLLREQVPEPEAVERALAAGRDHLARLQTEREQAEQARQQRRHLARQAKQEAGAGFAGRSVTRVTR